MLFQKSKVAAFTLLEAIVALLILSSSLLVFDGLSRNLSYDIKQQGQDTRKDWFVFTEQLRQELDQSEFIKLENNRIYVRKSGQELAFGQSKKDDFRKTNWSGQGYQPMLQGLKNSRIEQSGNRLFLIFQFESGLERTFTYAVEKTD